MLDRLDDVRAFTERSITADVRDVIQVNIDREPSETEVEEVECRATLQDQLAFQERMFVEFDEQLAQARNFFEIVGEKSGVTGLVICAASNFMFAPSLCAKGKELRAP